MIQVIVIVTGLLLVFLAVLLALRNMAKLVDDKTEMQNGFKIHLLAMGMMGSGGLLCFSGIVWYVLGRL